MRILDIPSGTDTISWLFWLAATGGLLYVFMEPGHYGGQGVLAGIFSSIKIEHNRVLKRIRHLETMLEES